jgi:hypothetical protein
MRGIFHSRLDTYPPLYRATSNRRGCANSPRLETISKNFHFDLLGSSGLPLGDVALGVGFVLSRQLWK